MKIEQDSAGVTFPPPFLFLGVLLVALLMGGWRIPLGDWLENLIGWTGIVLGGAAILSALGLFRRAGTNPEPWKTTTEFVTQGVYRRTRNPMYLGMALIYAGIAFLFDSMVALVLLLPVLVIVQRQVIEREEAYLEAKFGAAYRAYKASVRRWI